MEKLLQKFDNIEKRLENKIKARESKINILLWAIGALGILITVYEFIG